MIAKLQKTQTTAANESLVSGRFSREAPMIAEHLERPVLERHEPDSSGRKLRNRIIIANAIAWIMIIALICLMFF
jgi:hypothetical protein